MTVATELRAGATLLAVRTLVGALGITGDPTARALGRKAVTDPYPLYERIRGKGELSRHPLGIYLTASHSVARLILRDNRFRVGPAADNVGVDWNIRPGDASTLVHPTEQSLLTMNPPRHAKLRQVVAPWFTPYALRDRTDRMERIVLDFLSELAGRDRFDLVADFALRVPMRIICDLFGIPDDEYLRFANWGAVLSGTLDGLRTMTERRRVRAVLVEMTGFFTDLIARRRRQPGDDLVSALLRAEVDGQPLDRRDLVALAGMLLIGGFETTANAIAGGVVDLLRNPAEGRSLRDEPDFGPAVVEEVLRYETPAQFAIRFTTEPVAIAGVGLPAEAPVVLFLAGANRDPAVFTEPHRFDPHRPNNRDHLAFSSGVHFCLGAALARLETEIALRLLVTHLPDLELAGPIRLRRSRNIRGPRAVPVRRAYRRKGD
jgi:cytochrome P450